MTPPAPEPTRSAEITRQTAIVLSLSALTIELAVML